MFPAPRRRRARTGARPGRDPALRCWAGWTSGAAAGTATAPWLVLGVVLGVLLALLAGLVAAWCSGGGVRTAEQGRPATTAGDDLPALPGVPARVGRRAGGPAGRAGRRSPGGPAPLAPRPRPSPGTPGPAVVLTAMAVTALLAGRGRPRSPATSGPDGRRRRPPPPTARPSTRRAARLTFGGLVLEPRAVGVTATYPVVEVRADGDEAGARLELPTFNCLTAEAPRGPGRGGLHARR